MLIRDKHGSVLQPGDLVTAGDLLGTFRLFEDDEPLDFDGPVGRVVIEVDCEEQRFSAYAVGAENVCYDVAKSMC